MIWYLLIFSDKSQAVAYAWSIMGLAVKLAQSVSPSTPVPDIAHPSRSSWVSVRDPTIVATSQVRLPPCSLDRDGNRWKVIPEESQRRRTLFWELLNLDARLVCVTSFFALCLDLFLQGTVPWTSSLDMSRSCRLSPSIVRSPRDVHRPGYSVM